MFRACEVCDQLTMCESPLQLQGQHAGVGAGALAHRKVLPIHTPTPSLSTLKRALIIEAVNVSKLSLVRLMGSLPFTRLAILYALAVHVLCAVDRPTDPLLFPFPISR